MTAATTPVEARPDRSAPGAAPRFRADIQGLRAIAVLLVLAYHAGVPFVTGGYIGVDVFFVISGFLITGLIIRELETTGRLSLRGFYARRAKRLLPATAVVFIAVAILTVVAVPMTRWREIAGDIVASAIYLVNWRLADKSIDYLAAESATSPLQHFWSLAVEEQFYIIWPLLIVALFWRWRGGNVTRRLFWGLLAITIPSFLWSIYLTDTNPGAAYFVTTTRLWEMAIGALLAVVIGHADRIPRAVRIVIGWAGLVAIGYAALAFDASTPFPGAAALVPTMGAAAVLLAGSGDGRGEIKPLTAAPMQDVGALSYSLYLWHWPLLVVATAVWGREDGTLWLPTALMVVAASAVPAWFSYRIVEQPFHRSRRLRVPWRAGVVAAVCVAVGLASAGVVAYATQRESDEATSGEAIGAAALGDDPASSAGAEPVDSVPSITPALSDAPGDVADVYGDGCHQDQESSDVLSCAYGDEASETVIALIGDSHAAHWQPALRVLAEENGWRLETYTKSACLFGDIEVWNSNIEGPYESCFEWQSAIVDQLAAERPDVAVVSSSGSYRSISGGEPLARDEAFDDVTRAVAENWQSLESAGTEVLTIADTPWWGTNVPDCVAANENRLTECLVSRDEAMARSGAELHRAASELVPEADLIDLTDYVCPQDECVPVIGGVLLYSDSHHISATYSRTLAPLLEEPIKELLEE